jgi:predicted nucleotidyltransferase
MQWKRKEELYPSNHQISILRKTQRDDDMSIYTIEQIKERITPVARNHGVSRVMLFGSYARGEATEDSDVDLHVWCGNIRGLFALSGFRLDLVDALGKEVDLVTHGGMRKKFYERIKGDEVQIYGQI